VTLRALERPAAGEAAGALVLIHGRGADEHDLLPLLDVLDPERRFTGYTPRGPLALPPGGAHWYVVPRVGFPDPATFHESYAALGAWIDALPHEQVVIGGFSQGAVMSHAVALGRGRPRPAALIALSGFPPIVIAHGTYDPVIPVEFGRRARDTLVQAGAEPHYLESPVQHSIDPAIVPELQVLLASL